MIDSRPGQVSRPSPHASFAAGTCRASGISYHLTLNYSIRESYSPVPASHDPPWCPLKWHFVVAFLKMFPRARTVLEFALCLFFYAAPFKPTLHDSLEVSHLATSRPQSCSCSQASTRVSAMFRCHKPQTLKRRVDGLGQSLFASFRGDLFMAHIANGTPQPRA